MLKIEGLKLAPGESEALLYERAAAALRVKAPLHTLHILRRSIDARDGVTFSYTVSAALENEERVLRRARNKSVSVYAPVFYELPPMIAPPAVRPVVIGAGPAGLFAALEEALPLLEKKLHGFAAPDAVLTAVETRSSSPVRIVRDNTYQTALRGLYPCGEGAGYAGGILSAAADGMRCAEQIIKEITQHG